MVNRLRITINPEQCGGRPCLLGLRIRVSDVLSYLAAGDSYEEILEAYLDLVRVTFSRPSAMPPPKPATPWSASLEVPAR